MIKARSAAVTVPVVQVWIVRVLVPHRHVMMPMGVRLARRIGGTVGVLMMLVMDVAMLMVERLVHVHVLVPFGKVQIDAEAHEHGRRHELPR